MTELGAIPAAAAGGPTRLQVHETVEIAAPPEAVWAHVGRFADIGWLPGVHATDCPAGEMIGAVRVITLGAADGPTVTEELHSRDDAAMRLSYRITAVDPLVLPVANYGSEITVRPGAGGGTRLDWRGVFDPAEGHADAKAVEAITGIYRAGLDATRQALAGR